MKIDYKEYYDECLRLNKLVKNFTKNYKKKFTEYETKVAYYKYGYGSKLMFRGFYCPSLIEDIIIGNVKRGSVRDKKWKREPKYEYGFDSNGNLLTVFKRDGVCFEKEYIVRDGDFEYGIMFSGNSERENTEHLSTFTEVQRKAGRIIKYTDALISINTKVNEYRTERYNYKDGKLHTAEVIEYSLPISTSLFDFELKKIFKESGLNLDKNDSLNRCMYTFYYENDVMKKYTVTEYDPINVKKGYWDGHFFDV